MYFLCIITCVPLYYTNTHRVLFHIIQFNFNDSHASRGESEVKELSEESEYSPLLSKNWKRRKGKTMKMSQMNFPWGRDCRKTENRI